MLLAVALYACYLKLDFHESLVYSGKNLPSVCVCSRKGWLGAPNSVSEGFYVCCSSLTCSSHTWDLVFPCQTERFSCCRVLKSVIRVFGFLYPQDIVQTVSLYQGVVTGKLTIKMGCKLLPVELDIRFCLLHFPLKS